MIVEAQSFNVGEVVWAKIKGYCWWPAQVFYRARKPKTEEEFRTEYLVMFFGDNSHAYLPLQKLGHYQSKYQQFACQKAGKKFQQALNSADRFVKTGSGSLLEKGIVIDSLPLGLYLNKYKSNSTMADSENASRTEDLKDIPKPAVLQSEGTDFQQQKQLNQISEEDINTINTTNVVYLLESGIVQNIRSGNYQEQGVEKLEDKLKEELLKKYLLAEKLAEVKPIKEVPLMMEETQKPKTAIPRTKKIQKSKKSMMQAELQAREFAYKKSTICRLYSHLRKAKVDTEKSMKLSVRTVQRLINSLNFGSIEFTNNFKRILQWLYIFASSNSELIPQAQIEIEVQQKLEQLLEEAEEGTWNQLGEEKSRVSHSTGQGEEK